MIFLFLYHINYNLYVICFSVSDISGVCDRSVTGWSYLLLCVQSTGIYQKQFSFSGRVKSNKINFYFCFINLYCFEDQAVEILMLPTYNNCNMNRKANFKKKYIDQNQNLNKFYMYLIFCFIYYFKIRQLKFLFY